MWSTTLWIHIRIEEPTYPVKSKYVNKGHILTWFRLTSASGSVFGMSFQYENTAHLGMSSLFGKKKTTARLGMSSVVMCFLKHCSYLNEQYFSKNTGLYLNEQPFLKQYEQCFSAKAEAEYSSWSWSGEDPHFNKD